MPKPHHNNEDPTPRIYTVETGANPPYPHTCGYADTWEKAFSLLQRAKSIYPRAIIFAYPKNVLLHEVID